MRKGFNKQMIRHEVSKRFKSEVQSQFKGLKKLVSLLILRKTATSIEENYDIQ